MADLKTSIRITADDRFSAGAKKIASAGTNLGKRLSGVQREIAALSKRAGRVDQYGKLTSAIGKTGSEMRLAQAHTAALGRQLAQAAKPTKKLQAEFERARRISDRLGEKHREQRGKLRGLRDELRGAGIDTRKLGDAQRKLAADIERATGRMKRHAESVDRLGKARERVGRAGAFAVGASLAGGEISRVGASMRRFAGAPLEAAAEVGRARGRLATLSMSESGIDAVERVGRDLGGRLAGVELAGFIGAAYDVRSAMSALGEIDVAKVTGVAAELSRAADASTEQMTSAISGAYGVFKRPLFADLGDVEFVEKFSSQLSQAVESFRTTGGRMEEGIKSMGAGLSLAGVEMSEQLAALGMLQAAMPASEAGTALRSMRQGAVDAQEAFAKSGRDVRIIDKATGGLRPIAAILDDMERVFGAELDAREAAEIQEAFGREEAVRVIEGLWGSGKALGDAADQLEGATMADVRRRARDRDENTGGALDRMRQRWENFTSLLGSRLEGALAWIEPIFNSTIDLLEGIDRRWPWLTGGLTALVGGLGLVAAPLAGLVITFGGAAWAATALRLKILQLRAAMGGHIGPGTFGGPGGKGPAGRPPGGGLTGLPSKIKGLGARGLVGRVGEFGKGLPAKALGLFKGKAGYLGAALAALSIGSTLLDDKLSGAQKTQRVAGDAGGIGGALGGGALGAALGTAVFPGVGTLIGGILGSVAGGIAGGLGGEALGKQLGGLIKSGVTEQAAGLTPALAGAGDAPLGGLTAASRGDVDNSSHIGQLVINQQPGEDPKDLAKRVLREIEAERRLGAREAVSDEL